MDCSVECSTPCVLEPIQDSAQVISAHLSILLQVFLAHDYILFTYFASWFYSDMHIIFKHDLSQLRGFNNVNFLQNPARHKTSPWLGRAPAIHSSWTGQMPLVHSVTPSQSQETLATPVPSRAPWTECRWTFPVARATVLECWGRMISVRASQAPPPNFQLVQLPHTYYSSPCATQNVTDQANVFNNKMSV